MSFEKKKKKNVLNIILYSIDCATVTVTYPLKEAKVFVCLVLIGSGDIFLTSVFCGKTNPLIAPFVPSVFSRGLLKGKMKKKKKGTTNVGKNIYDLIQMTHPLIGIRSGYIQTFFFSFCFRSWKGQHFFCNIYFR